MKYLLYFFSLTFALIIFLAISFFFLKNHPGEVENLLNTNTALFVNGRLDLAPEPGERRIFLFGIIFLPAIVTVNYLILSFIAKKNRLFRKIFSNPYLNLATAWSGLFLILRLLTFIVSDLFKTKEQNIYLIFHSPLHYFLIFITLGIYIIMSGKKLKYINPIFLLSSLVAITLTSLYPLMPQRFFYTGWSMTHHFDQVLNLIIQAYHGKTSLVDFVSQYGVIYPHIA